MNDKEGIINNLESLDYNSDLRYKVKKELIIALKIMNDLNTDYGISGHITVRDPELAGHFWVNPFGVKFKDVNLDNLLLINDKGEVIYGNGLPNSAAIFIHGPFHWSSSKDINCIVHSHTFYSTALGITKRIVKPTTIESCEFYDDQINYENYTGVATSESIGNELFEFYNSTKKNIILLKHHGILIPGKSIKQVIWKLFSYEKCSKFQLYIDSLGTNYDALSYDIITKTQKELSTLKACEFQIKPLWSQYE